MAQSISYNDWEKQYNALDAAGKEKYNNLAKDNAVHQQYLSQYNAKNNPTSTNTSTVNNNTKTVGSTVSNNKNTSVNNTSSINTPSVQWNTQYTQPKDTIYNSNQVDVSKYVKQWNGLSYDQQQEVIRNNKDFRQSMAHYWLIEKKPEQTTVQDTKQETPKDTVKTTVQDEWDYQDNSQARMDQIANNLSNYSNTHPELFENEQKFRNFFIDGKGRSKEQEEYLMQYYNDYKKYNQYDNLSAEQIGNWLVNWNIPSDYLNWIKANDPAKFEWVRIAMQNKQDQINNESYLTSLQNESWLNTGINENNKFLQRQENNLQFIDKDNNWVDDRRENYMTDEEKNYAKTYADNIAEIQELQNMQRDMLDDLTAQYPWVPKATLLWIVQDRTKDAQKRIDELNIENTRLQWYLGYLQTERQEKNKAGAESIAQLQGNLKSYYTYSPDWLKELADAEYAALHPTLEAAENWTDAEKQRALETVLQWYYDKYWDIIQRPMQQVIQDVITEAKNTWKTLSEVLKSNFVTPLQNKPEFNSLNTIAWNWKRWLEAIKDSNWNIIWYVGYNQKDGNIQTYDWILWAMAGNGSYNSERWVYNFSDAFAWNLEKNLWYKNNNPWNIKDWAFWDVVGKDSKNFAIFETPEDWFDALVEKIKYNQTNPNSKYYGKTIRDYVKMYAPKDDGNDPYSYAQYLANKLWATVDTPISVLDATKMAAAIARKESWYKYETYWMFRGNWANWTSQAQWDYNNPAYSPMYEKINKALNTGKLTKDEKSNLQLAEIIYRNFYDMAIDGSLDHFLNSWDFQNIMSKISKRSFTKSDEWESFLDAWKNAIERANITDQTNLWVIRTFTQMIEKKLRKESWAAISSSEWLSNFDNYIPAAWESYQNKMKTMLSWEKNLLEPVMRYAWVPTYEWLFKEWSPYYKTEHEYTTTNEQIKNSLGTWDFGEGTIVWLWNNWWEYWDLFTILGYNNV